MKSIFKYCLSIIFSQLIIAQAENLDHSFDKSTISLLRKIKEQHILPI
jgi:hypothetical protein